VKEIEKTSIPVKNSAEIKNIATASASGNTEIGSLIAEAMEKVNNTGVVTIEEAKGMTTTIEIVEGMQFDRGYISPYFCTNAEKMSVEMAQPAILVLDKKVSNIHELLPILQQVATTGKQLLIIAEDIEGDALSTLVVNKLRGTLKVAAVKSPGFGDSRKNQLQDIAALTGATLVSEDMGESLKELSIDSLGSAEKVTITKDHTLIVGGSGSKEKIQARVKQIDAEIALVSGYEKEKLIERKARLSGGVAVIRVGAATEPEMKQKKQAFEDSLSSTKSALEQGIVPGGGVALLRASKVLSGLKLEGDEALGSRIVLQMCETPIKQIISNAGLDSSVVLSEVLKKEGSFGFNAANDTVEDLLKAGIIDPAKVVKTALTHASEIALNCIHCHEVHEGL
jgi:chaperonin GroEL